MNVDKLHPWLQEYLRTSTKLDRMREELTKQRALLVAMEEKIQNLLQEEKDHSKAIIIPKELCQEYGQCVGITLSRVRKKDAITKKRLEAYAGDFLLEAFGKSNSKEDLARVAGNLSRFVWDKCQGPVSTKVRLQIPKRAKAAKSEGVENVSFSREDGDDEDGDVDDV